MQTNTKRTKKHGHYSVLIIRIASLLGCLMLISLYMLSGVYSKFYSAVSSGDQAGVSIFTPYFNSVGGIDVSNATPGYSNQIEFNVQNYSDEKVTETAVKYKIILKTTGNIPLTFTLLENEIELQRWDCDGTSGEQIYEYTDNSLVFDADVRKSYEYKMKAKWQNDKKNAQFSGMTDAVYLEVEFEQID